MVAQEGLAPFIGTGQVGTMGILVNRAARAFWRRQPDVDLDAADHAPMPEPTTPVRLVMSAAGLAARSRDNWCGYGAGLMNG